MKTLWQLLGKTAEPVFHVKEPLSTGDCSVCVCFDGEGPVMVEFKWLSDVVRGQRSHDPLVEDDPDTILCTDFKVAGIYNYDIEGTETRVPVTPELEQAFIAWIQETRLINVDMWAI
jgi:hypothetical protein